MRLSNISFRKMSTATTVRSTAASGSQVYDTDRAVNEYLLFHYSGYSKANEKLHMPYSFGPKEALNFPRRTAELCIHASTSKTSGTRALDIGCSVGGSSFELGQHFDEVVGIDYSQYFIDAANHMKTVQKKSFEVLKQGKMYEPCSVELPDHLASHSNKVSFLQGDACNLSPSLDKFDVIHASNLMCRLPSPRAFLQSIPQFLKPGGLLVLVSPYSWLEEYTPVSEWVGAVPSANTSTSAGGVDSFSCLQAYLEQSLPVGMRLQLISKVDIPFLIREHERKFQYGVSDATIWKLPIQ